jgi:hypothetical protein
VDFSTAYQKKVVLYCIIHTYGGYSRPSDSDLAPDYSVYATSSGKQRLYMYYNSAEGKKEYLSEARARLWDDETNELLAEFTRVSNEEWNADYLPPYKITGGSVNEYSIHLRLEVEIPGQKTLVSRATLERTINTAAWEIHYGLLGGYYYIQRNILPGPVWFLPEAVEAVVTSIPEEIGSASYQYVKHVPVHYLQSNYVFADPFNYSDDRFLYGIRVLPQNKDGESHYTMMVEKIQGETIDDYHSRVYYTYINLLYVSDEYDHYLKDAIVYRIRHDNATDPLKHLYEDQVFTNVEGGVGIFGIEVRIHPSEVIFD